MPFIVALILFIVIIAIIMPLSQKEKVRQKLDLRISVFHCFFYGFMS
jgi:hypothetical protein